MKRLPPLKSLQYFATAAQQRSFKRAASVLNVTQAAVSQQIRQLEENLQLALFIREGRQMKLTEAGRNLLPYLQRGFEEIQAGVDAVSGDPEPQVLRISILHSFASLWLLPRLHDFQAKYPDLLVQLAPGNELVDFQQGDLDIAIRMGWGGYQPLEEKKLLADKQVLVASPSLLKGVDTSDPQQIFALPWIEDTVEGVQRAITHCCAHFGIARERLKPVISATNAVPLIESAVAGRGVMIMNSCLVLDHLKAGRLVTLLDYAYPSPYSLFLVAPKQHFSWAKVRQFEDWIVPAIGEAFADLQEWTPAPSVS